VRSGLGVGFVPEDFLLPETGAQNIRVLPLTPPLPKRALLLMQRKNEPLSLAAKAFCHVLRAGSGC
jgi:DNA-binding transcriptional LysR family regulator